MTRTVVQILGHAHGVDRTDGQLLDLFVQTRDQEAFAAVVRRHGPMVLGVCRRVLRNHADADDAFQAAFLVLAKKAASVGRRERLAQWLHGVAFNTARRLRRTNTRRGNRERPMNEVAEPAAAGGSAGRDELVAILDEELAKLPERYRLPIVLCDLQGTTRKEAARQLGCPEGTVAGRLARARALLAERLTARGVVPMAALLAVLAERAAAVSPALVANVLRVVGGGVIPARVAETTEGVLKAMFAKKLRAVAAAVFLCGFVLVGGVGVFRANAQPAPQRQFDPIAKPAPEAAKKMVTVVPLKKLDGKATAEKLTQTLPESITVAAVRDENAVIVYATEQATREVMDLIRTFGEDIAKPAAKPSPDPKRYAVSWRNTPWADVLDWYAKETGLTLTSTVKPTGTVTITPPKDRQFTLGEVTDLINEALIQQNFILIRRQVTFLLHPADEKLDLTLIPRIELTELPNRGRTELVQVVLSLKVLVANEVAPEVQKMLTPFGAVAAIEKLNALIVTDTAGNIKRIYDTTRTFDEIRGENVFHVYPCKWQRAADVIEQVRNLVNDSSLRIAAERSSNSVVIIGGSAKTIELVKKLLPTLDKAKNPDDKPIAPQDPELRKYAVPAGTAEEVAKALVAADPSLRLVPVPQANEIFVLATPDGHTALAKKLREITDSTIKKE